MIQLTRTGAKGTISPDQQKRLAQRFRAENHIRLPEIIAPDLLLFIRERIEEARFEETIHEKIGSNKELSLPAHLPVQGLLWFLVNDPLLFQFIERIAGCGSIGCFSGRVYRVVPGCGHHDAWHADLSRDRVAAMSINLSTEVYQGAALQIRDARSRRLLQEVPNVGYGDAVVFRLSHELEHRITEIEGKQAKTAFAGWFLTQPDFRSCLTSEQKP